MKTIDYLKLQLEHYKKCRRRINSINDARQKKISQDSLDAQRERLLKAYKNSIKNR